MQTLFYNIFIFNRHCIQRFVFLGAFLTKKYLNLRNAHVVRSIKVKILHNAFKNQQNNDLILIIMLLHIYDSLIASAAREIFFYIYICFKDNIY